MIFTCLAKKTFQIKKHLPLISCNISRWSAKKVVGKPTVYPQYGEDVEGAWKPDSSETAWIEVISKMIACLKQSF